MPAASVKQILIGQRVLDSGKWKLQATVASVNTSRLPKKKED
jgi:hypothetical protein